MTDERPPATGPGGTTPPDPRDDAATPNATPAADDAGAPSGAAPAADDAGAPSGVSPSGTEGTAGAGPGDEPAAGATAPAGPPASGTVPRRRRDWLAATLIGVLTLLLGFAIAVQVRSTGADEQYASAREEDLVRILDELDAREDRLRAQIAEQRSALAALGDSDSQSAAALEAARERAEALGILNGTVAAEGPGLVMTIRDPGGEVRVADLLATIQELRGAGAETMQVDGVRIGVSSAVTGTPGALRIDGRPISQPYEVRVIGSPQDLQTAMNIPGGVVDSIGRRGGSVLVEQSERVLVDALRPLDSLEHARPAGGGN